MCICVCISVCVCVCVCVHTSVCVSVCLCLSVQAITFEAVDTETSYLVWWYILTISRSSTNIKVIGSYQDHVLKNAYLAKWTSV